MSDVWTILRLFPENGLDRSLHVPVFLGLILLSFFRETLGWSFAGLVVPGYLATVLVAAPVTGALVVAEATLAYMLALLLGRALPKVGFGFTIFGRERFLLIIACGSLVRLVVEASLLPLLVARWNMTHSRELYSLGLVLVPLLANSFWNAGFIRAFPRIALVTGLTYWLVADVLLPYTNYTLSRFQVANESVSLAFLESPHAHIVLLVGAIVAARNNVRYGWDYNGILVPALLAVAWYEPTKVATTVGEAIIVYLLSRGMMQLPPLSGLMVIGSRRVLLTFSVGFCLKYLLGSVLFRWYPQVELLDFFGFGYLLPSLLANKMWDRNTIAGVLMPTLQVSLIAFPLGTLVGFGLRTFEVSNGATVASYAPTTITPSVATALLLGDLAPAPARSGSGGRFVDAYQVAEALALHLVDTKGSPDRQQQWVSRSGLRTEQDPLGHWTILTPDDQDSNLDPAGPRAAVRTSERYGDRWLVLVDAAVPTSPTLPIASALATQVGARAIVVRSRFTSIAQRDEDLALHLAASLKLDKILWISVDEHSGPAELQAVGALPAEVSTQRISQQLQVPVQLTWRALGSSDTLLDKAVHLRFTREQAERAASSLWSTPQVETWNLAGHAQWLEKIEGLTQSDPMNFRVPSTRELRLYGQLLQRLRKQNGPPSQWQQALAAQLGLRFAITQGMWNGWALYEPQGPRRRGLPTIVRRQPSTLISAGTSATTSSLSVALAAPRWQQGGIASALRLAQAFSADQLLVHGTLVNVAADGAADPRRPTGRHLWFQRAHEVWMEQGGNVILLRALPEARSASHGVVARFDTDVTSVNSGPTWTQPLIQTLQLANLNVTAVDGTAARSGLTASGDPAVAYAHKFAPDRLLLLWLARSLRDGWRHFGTRSASRRRLERSQMHLATGSPSQLLRSIQRCQTTRLSAETCSPFTLKTQCKEDIVTELLQSHRVTKNPFFLASALKQAQQCGWVAALDAVSEVIWLARPSPFVKASDRLMIYPLVRFDAAQTLDSAGAVGLNNLEAVSQLALSPLRVRLP